MANFGQVFKIFPRVKFDLAVNYVKANLGSSYEHFCSHPQCYIPRSMTIGFLVLKKMFEEILPYMGMSATLVVRPGSYLSCSIHFTSACLIHFCENMIKFIDGNPD